MAQPINVITFGGLDLISDIPGGLGSPPENQQGKGRFTDVLQDYTLPNVRLTPVRIGIQRANYPIKGMIEDMVCQLTISGHTPAIVGQVGARMEFDFSAELEDYGLTGSDDAHEYRVIVGGWCNAYDPGQVQGPYSTPQTAGIEVQVTKYILDVPTYGGARVTPEIYHIDLDQQIYMRHGVDLWRSAG